VIVTSPNWRPISYVASNSVSVYLQRIEYHEMCRFRTTAGELVEGWEVAWRINQLSVGKPDNQAGREEEAVITDSGQLRRGDPIVLPAEQ